jgi:hypothetical protein
MSALPTMSDIKAVSGNRETLAGGGATSAVKKELWYVYVEAGADYKKLLFTLYEHLGYVVIGGARKRGGQRGSRKKRDHSKLPGGIKLPTGPVLVAHVDVLKNGEPGIDNKTALRRLLEATLGHQLKEAGASDHKIKTLIDKEFVNLERRYYAARAEMARLRK